MRQIIARLGLVLITLVPLSASAISGTDSHAIKYDAIYQQDGDGGTCAVAVSIGLIGSDNAAKVYNYLLGKGLTPAQVSGIMGNLQQESGINPGSMQTVGGSAKGIAQWEGDRFTNLVAFAANLKLPWTDLGVQLQFLWQELTTNRAGALTAVKGTNNPTDAATVFELNFEGASIPVMENRIKYANQFFAKYGGGGSSGGSATTVASPIGGCSSVTGTGQDTKYIDGFTLYSQYDPVWKDKPYGDSTVGNAGCGPSSMAMIITNLTGNKVTPDVIAAQATAAGQYITGVGSASTLGPVIAAKYHLTATPVGNDVAKITAALQAGSLVIVSGTGPLPFTSEGHLIVIRGVAADGKWKIGDPGHNNTSDKEWDPASLVPYMQAASNYAISKPDIAT